MKSFRILVLVVILLPSLILGQWVQTNFSSVTCFAVNGTYLFAIGNGGVLLSSDNGESWTEVNEGLPSYITSYLNCLTVSGSNLFAGARQIGMVPPYPCVYLSTDSGTTWTAAGLVHMTVMSFAVSGANLFALTSHNGIFRSTDNGAIWTAVNEGLLDSIDVSLLFVNGTNCFAGTEFGSVYLSTNNGDSWTMLNDDFLWTVLSFVASGTNLFAGTAGGGVFLSTDNGTNWTAVNKGLDSMYVSSLFVNGTNLFAGTNDGVFLSTDNGTSWTSVNEGLTNLNVTCFAVNGTNLFAGTWEGVWRRPLLEMITSVENPSTDLPIHYYLKQNYPNPFNPSTTIEFAIPNSGFVSLKVYNVMGQEVAILLNKELPSGNHKVEWKPENLSSGIYFYKLETKGYQETKKLVFMK